MISRRRRGARVWFHRLRVMTVKELLQLFRDVVLMFFVAYAFTVDIYNAGSGVTLQLKNAALTVLDADHSFASRELVHRFRPDLFRLDGEIDDSQTGLEMLDAGQTMFVLDIPPSFQEDLQNGKPTSVQLQVDTTNTVLGVLGTSYASQIVGRFGLEAGLARIGQGGGSGLEMVPRIEEDHRVWFNPNQNDEWFMSLSQLLNVITLFAIMLPAAAMVREKERGTVEQLLVSPLSPFQIMLPKVLAMTAVILAGTMLSLGTVIFPVFGVPIKGSLGLFLAVTALFVFTSAGLGLFAATIARNLPQVGMITILIFAPMVFLSGAWTPPEAMPLWLRAMMTFSPLHHYMDVSFGIFLRGAGMDLLWDSVLAIALLGGAIFAFGIWRFNRQFG